MAALPFGERACGIHWIGGWVNLRAPLDAVENSIKFLYFPVCSVVVMLAELSQLLQMIGTECKI